MTNDELIDILGLIEQGYPDWYGYIDWTSELIEYGKYPYLVFRNRDESFDKANTIAVLVVDEVPR